MTGIQLAQNILLEHPVSVYLNYLGPLVKFKRHEMENGLYYSNGMRILYFYDKVIEQEENGISLPDWIQRKNLLRYELRFRSRLSDQFNKNEVLAKHLYDEVFYVNIIKTWKKEYFRIAKLTPGTSSISPTGSSKELIERLVFLHIRDIKEKDVFNMINEWQAKGYINKKQASDNRKKIKGIIQTQYKEYNNNLIEELNQKIELTTRYYR